MTTSPNTQQPASDTTGHDTAPAEVADRSPATALALPQSANLAGPSDAGKTAPAADGSAAPATQRKAKVSSSGKSREELIRQRWSELSRMGIAATCAVLIAGYSLWSQVLAFFGNLPLWMITPVAVAAAIALHEQARTRPRAFFGLRHFLAMPPVWIAALLGLGALLILTSVALFSSGDPLLIALALPSLSLGLMATASYCLCYTLAIRKAARVSLPTIQFVPPQLPPRTQGKLENVNALRAWLNNDAPVADAESDLFDHQAMAERIAERLSQPNPEAEAVLGRLGAGKTTLRRLVESSLQRRGPASAHVRLVSIELWPFETSKAAVEGVIRSLVEAVSTEVSVLPLRGLPEAYSQVMSATGAERASALLKLQDLPASPFETLERLDDIATAIGLQYVVWVEDLERFAGSALDENAKLSTQDAEKLNHLRALLLGLDRLSSFTVVTATLSLHTRFDIEKIARHISDIPELDPQKAGALLHWVHTTCLGMVAHNLTASGTRPNLGLLFDNELLSFMRHIGPRPLQIADALLHLCRTPRQLKQALRSVIDTWQVLKGEVDFDDLFVMSILRTTHPNAFATLRQHASTLRPFPIEHSQPVQDPVNDAWKASLTSLSLDKSTTDAVNEIAKFAFTGDRITKPQGFVHRSPVDYWHRFLTVPQLHDDERDQPVIEAIESKDTTTLLKMLDSEHQANLIDAFEHRISPTHLRDIFLKFVHKHVKGAPTQTSPLHPQSFIRIWHIHTNRVARGNISREQVAELVMHAYDICVPWNLTLTALIEQHFVLEYLHTTAIVHSEARPVLKEKLRTLLIERIKSTPSTLIEGLLGAKPFILVWIIWGLDRLNTQDTAGLPFEGWPVLRDAIMSAFKQRPDVMGPQLARLVVDGRSLAHSLHVQSTEPRCFIPREAETLFGSVDLILDAFAPHSNAAWVKDPHTRARASAS